LNTSYYLAAEKLGKIGPGVLFEGTIPDRPSCPLLSPLCDLHAPMDNNWVNTVPMGDEALLLTDAPLMLRYNLKTLAVTGAYPWEDSLDEKYHKATSGSAHPVLLPGTTSTYIEITPMVAIVPFTSPKVNIYSFDSTGSKKRSLVASAPMKNTMYFHSFGVTENHVVLPANLKMGAGLKDLTHRPYMLSHFEDGWDGIHVVDIKNKSAAAQKFDTEKFFHVHIANTFENATGIVMDIGTDPVIPFSDGPALTTAKFLNKTLRDERDGDKHPQLRRYHMHLAGASKGSVTYEPLSMPGRMTDFFKINPAYNGISYCFIYMSEWFHDDKAYASMAILKQDVCKGTKTYWHINNNYPGEPTFIAKPGGEEDDGIVVFPNLDGDKRTSTYVILDGKTFKQIAAVPLGTHIPFTAHGRFFPEAAAALSTGSDPVAAITKAMSDSYIV